MFCVHILFLLSAIQIVMSAMYVGDFWDRATGGQRSEQEKVVMSMLRSSLNMIKDTDHKILQTRFLRLNSLRSIPFEVGYVMYNIQEEYRRMVDKYETCVDKFTRYYHSELILYLEDIEYHFWKIEHLAYMLHEIERKYGLKGNSIRHKYYDPDKLDDSEDHTEPSVAYTDFGKNKWGDDRIALDRKKKLKKARKQQKKLPLQPIRQYVGKPTRKAKKWFKIDYGWEAYRDLLS